MAWDLSLQQEPVDFGTNFWGGPMQNLPLLCDVRMIYKRPEGKAAGHVDATVS